MDSDRIERDAADWLARRDSGQWTEAQEAAFSAWQSQSTAHRVAVIRLKTVWQEADRLQALGAGVSHGHIPAPRTWRLSPFFDQGARARAVPTVPAAGESKLLEGDKHPRKWQAVAASAALIVGAAVAWSVLEDYDPSSYHTAVGDIKAVPLADGSKITLNTDSRIHVILSTTERRIDLESGEVFFDVAKDPARPFVVRTAGKRIVAVGTKFAVLREGQTARVIVTEGQVRVEETASDAPRESTTQLAAGSIAQAGAAGVLVKQGSIAEAETYLSWRSGYIALHDTALPEAVAEFNRYNKKQLVIGDPTLAYIRIGGNLRATNLTAFVRVLEQGFPVRATDESDRIVLSAR